MWKKDKFFHEERKNLSFFFAMRSKEDANGKSYRWQSM